MHHAGQATARAGADVGRGARDGSGDADPAEDGRGDVGDALRHQFHVGAMFATGVMPSATLADKAPSTPPSSVNDSAEGSSRSKSWGETGGRLGIGRAVRSRRSGCPMVAAGRCSDRGGRGQDDGDQHGAIAHRRRLRPKINAADPRPMARVAGPKLGRACASATILGISGPGSGPDKLEPTPRSFNWLAVGW